MATEPVDPVHKFMEEYLRIQNGKSPPHPIELSTFFQSLPYQRLNEDGSLTVSSHPFIPPNQPWYRRHGKR